MKCTRTFLRNVTENSDLLPFYNALYNIVGPPGLTESIMRPLGKKGLNTDLNDGTLPVISRVTPLLVIIIGPTSVNFSLKLFSLKMPNI